MDNNTPENTEAAELKCILRNLVTGCEKDLRDAEEQLSDIYSQYGIADAHQLDAPTLAIIGGHINKTAELRIKVVGEKVKVADLVHKIIMEHEELGVAHMLAQQKMSEKQPEDIEEELYETTRNSDDMEEESAQHYEDLMKQIAKEDEKDAAN